MTTPELDSIFIPLEAAFKYAVGAKLNHGRDRQDLINLMLARLGQAAKNAGLVKAETESKKAA